MKRVSKNLTKAVTLSMLLSFGISNYALALEINNERITTDTIKNDGRFINIDNDKNVYTTFDSKDKITINDAYVDAYISNVQTVKHSTVDGVYGGYGYNTNNNVIEISSNSEISNVAGGAYGESNNHNTLTIENSYMGTDVFGGGYGSDNNFNKITLKNTTADSIGGIVAGGYYIYDSSVGNSTDRVNVIENEVNVIGRDIENEVNESRGKISNLYGGQVDNFNRVIKNINVKGNNVKIDYLGKSRDDSEDVYNIIGGEVRGAVDSSKKVPGEVKWNSSDTVSYTHLTLPTICSV